MIRLLSDQTINQIAAGEVVDRPASVVKELVENSLDAGGRRIEIDLQGGGLQLIEISDDGCGMSRQDSLLCFERHATSKIRAIDDLERVATLGFRGEALPSIASIAKVELVSCLQGETEGSRVVIEGGKILAHGPAGRSHGTTLSIRSLFYNLPARRKFQKSPSQQLAEIHKLLSTTALAHPSVEFRLTQSGTTLLHLPPVSATTPLEQLRERGAELLTDERPEEWLPLEWEREGLLVRGWLSRPSHHRPNRTGHYLYVNQRPITSPLISKAVTEGYGSRLPVHRYPLFILHLELPGEELDVNVHPQKREVRFREEELLSEAVHSAVTAALQKAFAPTVQRVPLPVAPMERSPSFFSLTPAEPIDLPRLVEQSQMEFRVDPVAIIGRHILYDGERLPRRLEERFGPLPGGALLVDGVAARGRVLLEQLLRRIEREEGFAQQLLLVPTTLDLSPSEAERVAPLLDRLNSAAFSIRPIGRTTFLIDALPVDGVEDPKGFLFDWIEAIEEHREERELARLAARRAGGGVKRMALVQASALVEELLACHEPWEGPMGGSTCLPLPLNQIEELFRR